MNVMEKLIEVSRFLKNSGIEDSAKEAEILITETLQISKTRLYSSDLEISEDISKNIDSLIIRRAKREPLQYVIGHVEFCGLRINVGRGVLIPRPETELLVKEALKTVASYRLQTTSSKKQGSELRTPPPKVSLPLVTPCSPLKILDLCTGSGCIAIALARYLPDAMVYGVDKSETAISYSIKNSFDNGIKNVYFVVGDLFGPVGDTRFDCIVSNPPYISRLKIPYLQKEIKDYEPVDAFDGGEDGLYFYRRIIKEAPEYLKERGHVVLEIGHDQADDVEKMAREAGFGDIRFAKDYAGIRRVFIGRPRK